MSKLVDLVQGDAAALRLDTRLAGVNISVHGGQFTDAELVAYGARAPHIVLAALRGSLSLTGGAPWLDVFLCAVVLESDRPGAAGDRHTRGMALTDATLRALARLETNVHDSSRPKDLDARNAYAPAWDRKGLSCWVITWKQTVTLTDTTVWNDFRTLDTKYDLTPRDNGAPLGQVPEAEDEQELA